MKYYTVYKGDEIVAFGSSRQCNEMLGLKDLRQFYAFISKVRSGLRPNYAVVIDQLDEETEL